MEKFEIKLSATNKADKRKKKGTDTRSIYIEAETVKALEHQRVSSKETYLTFDPEAVAKAETNNSRLGGSQMQSIEKTIRQFFDEFAKVPSLINASASDYIFGSLHNADGSPIAREDNRGKNTTELTKMFKALLIISLESRDIEKKEAQTINTWLEFFGFINEQMLDDLKSYYKAFARHHEIKEYNLEHDEKIIEENEFVSFLVQNNYISDTAEKVHMSDRHSATVTEHPLSDTEILNAFNAYIDVALRSLKIRLFEALNQLHKEKIIHFQSYMMGAEIYRDHENKKRTRLVQLTPSEVIALIELETRIREELELDDLTGYKLYQNKKFKMILSDCLEIGLKTAESYRSFEYVYEAHTITKRFTKKQINSYLDKHKDIKNYYSKGNELINEYRFERVQHVSSVFDRRAERSEIKALDKNEQYLSKYQPKDRKVLSRMSDTLCKSEIINGQIYNQLNKELSIKLMNYRHTDSLHTLKYID